MVCPGYRDSSCLESRCGHGLHHAWVVSGFPQLVSFGEPSNVLPKFQQGHLLDDLLWSQATDAVVQRSSRPRRWSPRPNSKPAGVDTPPSPGDTPRPSRRPKTTLRLRQSWSCHRASDAASARHTPSSSHHQCSSHRPSWSRRHGRYAAVPIVPPALVTPPELATHHCLSCHPSWSFRLTSRRQFPSRCCRRRLHLHLLVWVVCPSPELPHAGDSIPALWRI